MPPLRLGTEPRTPKTGRMSSLGSRVGIAASVVLILIAAFLATRGEDGAGDVAAVETPPRLVGPAELAALAAASGHDLYWAGNRRSHELEISEEPDGSVYLRYLPSGVEAGDPRAEFLTVGTYPVPDAVGALRRSAAEAGSELGHAGNGVTFVNPSSPGSVYLAYPGSDLQIEVYDPRPGRTLQLIRSGAVEPVG